MRIIRFLDNDGRVHHGDEHGDGTATVLHDPQGVLGRATSTGVREIFAGMRALVADDDANMRELMATVLASVGCECTVCADGAEAIDSIAQAPPDLIVSDIVMPHQSGYEIFAAARAQRGDMPVVLVTGFGYDPSHSLIRASQDGLQSILYKPFTPQQLLDEILNAIRVSAYSPADALVRTADRVHVATHLAPIEPRNVICIGRNYRSAPLAPGDEEEGVPIEDLEVFMKPTTAVQGPNAPILIPDAFTGDTLIDVEGELAVVIGSTAKDVAEEAVSRFVLGYTVATDVTASRFQTGGGAPIWMRGKGFDTFCPLGPAVVTTDSIPDPDDLSIRTIVGDTVRRSGSTRQMIRAVPTIVSALSRLLTLEPGTVILTGAPPATGDGEPLVDGDAVVVEIDGIGRLANRVEAAAVRA